MSPTHPVSPAAAPLAPRRTARRLTALAACLGVGASLAAVAVSPTAHAAPVEDCATAFPLAEVTADAAVTGLTVSRGTTPEAFTGTVLGVLRDGIGPGRDMIMMELDSPAIAKAGGIWQGMSGSPVYAEDGRLIGAVAYGLAYGTTPIAGITPFVYMEGYLGPAAPATRVAVGDRAAARIASTGEVTERQASQGFRALPIPRVATGVDPARADDHRRTRSYLRGLSYAGTGGTAQAADAASIDTVVAGGNLAAVQSVGDVTFAGVGTVTSVCDGRAVGFGHPMQFVGETTYGLGAADAVYIQEDPLGVPFKVANIGETGGTITDDRLAGISGPLGPVPATATITSDLTFDGRHRVGSTDVYDPAATASVAYSQSLANHDTVLDEITSGSELQTWVVEGTSNGTPFSLTYTDRIRSLYDLADEASYGLADTLWSLSQMPGVTLTSATSTVDATEDDSAYRVRMIEQKVGKRWVEVDGKRLRVAAGSTLRLRATVGSGDVTKRVVFSQRIPLRSAGATGRLIVGGGEGWLDVYGVGNIAELRKALAADPRNDSVVAEGRLGGEGAAKVVVDEESAPLDKVVTGRRVLKVLVR